MTNKTMQNARIEKGFDYWQGLKPMTIKEYFLEIDKLLGINEITTPKDYLVYGSTFQIDSWRNPSYIEPSVYLSIFNEDKTDNKKRRLEVIVFSPEEIKKVIPAKNGLLIGITTGMEAAPVLGYIDNLEDKFSLDRLRELGLINF